ncbi:MAG TPA: pyridoxamine 5'-phosphate oxidase family protein [Candidatus Saccharimonadales bacterium]
MTSLEILAFLDAHELCVLSTADEKGKPASAVVGFTVHDDFQIIVATSGETRKVANVAANPQVAVVVWDGSQTLQLEGKARVLEGKEIAEWQQKHFAKRPDSQKYKDDPNERYILIEPTWLRFTDASRHPWHVDDLTF